MMPTEWIKNKAVLLAIVALFIFSASMVSADISGTVTGPDGEPVVSSIRVFEESREIASIQSTETGFYIDLPSGQYTMTVLADEPETDGYDYLPVAISVDGEFNGTVVLQYGATVRLTGDFQYVDTENIPLKNVFDVQRNSEIVVSSGFPLSFSDKSGGIYTVIDLPDRDIIVPVDSVIDLNVSSSILIDSEITRRSFIISELETPGKGGILAVDVREYTIPISKTITDEKLDQLETQLAEMDQYGFYLAKQETALSNGIEYLEDSEIHYEAANYDSSFGSLKRGYILFDHTNTELVNMYLDAKFSVYLLIAFLTIASIITGYLLFDELVKQVLIDIIILGASLVFFYYTYPGSRTIPLTNFILVSVSYLAGFIILGSMFPRFFSRSSTDGRVHTRNLIAPIFNLARRSLRRRRVRFLLTFISITLLVMSFVTLTSFSEGYGLITGENQPKTGWTGVYIKEGTWTQSEPSFIINDETEYNWLRGQPEADYMSPKAESTALTYPLLNVLGQNIRGVIGVGPEENTFIDIMDTIVTGEMPTGNGVLISEVLAEATGLSMGAEFYIGLNQYTVSGVISDNLFAALRDVDGTPYAPDKWVNTNPDGETPNYVLKEADPSEVLIMSIEAALQIPMVGVQRIAFKINPEYNATGFAERLALERGYLSWANTDEAYTSYRLGNYFQGKGATLVIPWVIVVLNVVVTMLNSLYERRKEIEILSSVGLNPAQVSSIFVAEAAITGFIAGGLGYLVGLGFYKALAILNIGLQVNQKVSAVWSLASIGLAISAVVTGAFAALQNSVVITPSLMRRWKIDRSSGGFQEPWNIDVPIKLEPGEVDVYLDYVEMKLRQLENHHTQITSSIKRSTEGDQHIIRFIYKSVQTTTGNFYTRNTLRVAPLENGEYGAFLESFGEPEWVHVAGSLVRRISMDYSAEKNG